MTNLVNPQRNMNGGGYVYHYIAMYGQMSNGGQFSVCLEYKTKNSEPFQSAVEFFNELKDNGFVGSGTVFCYAIPASGILAAGNKISGIYASSVSDLTAFGIVSDYGGSWATENASAIEHFNDYVV